MQAIGLEDSTDWYCLLNVESTASNDEIQKAYKALSKTFHPDRLRAQNADESDQAQETFVKIKTACELLAFDEVLRDPVYRFAYDMYGHEGVRYLALCQQVKDGGQATQQHLLSLDISLYGELKNLLQDGAADMRMRLATKHLKKAMERYRQQLKVIKERLQDSALSFDATLELPCAYHPQAALVAEDGSNVAIPYLELEEARMEFSVRTSNQSQLQTLEKNRRSAEPKPQRHIYSTKLGAKTTWAATGKGGAEVSLEGNYKLTPASKTAWDCEVSTPISKVSSSTRPIKVQVSSTHEFLGGTVTNLGVRGSNASRDGWEYFLSSHRRLMIGGGETVGNDGTTMLKPNISASCAGGMKAFSGQPLYGFVTLTTIAPTHEKHHTSHQSDKDEATDTTKEPFWSPSLWSCSTPILSLRAGYHPIPIYASIKYEEFGKSWATLYASWSWNMVQDFSKVKVMLSADLWGSYEDNDSTTLRTGLRHDMMSGWIWLWEWEEMDWTLKVPISLSYTKNVQWVALAMGWETLPADAWHNAIGTLLASCLVYKVGQTMLADWIPDDNINKRRDQSFHKSADATFSERDQQGQQTLESAEDEIFGSLMARVADKKRTAELASDDGLVIRSAKLILRKTAVSAADDADEDDPFASSVSPVMETHDLTNRLQFWVRDGKLTLPPLSSQASSTTTHYYSIGGMAAGNSRVASPFSTSSLWSAISHVAQVCSEQLGELVNWLGQDGSSVVSSQIDDAKESFPYDIVVRYQHRNSVYEVSLNGREAIVLPHPQALLLGPVSTVM